VNAIAETGNHMLAILFLTQRQIAQQEQEQQQQQQQVSASSPSPSSPTPPMSLHQPRGDPADDGLWHRRPI
jgi:hypothetical protein